MVGVSIFYPGKEWNYMFCDDDWLNNFLPYGSSLMKEPRGFLGGNVMF